MTKSIIDNQISVYDCSFYQRISVFIPNEIKEGQARFTMITSVGRTYYVLFKWATELIKNLFAFIVFSLLCFAVVAMFYPTGGKYVLVATITNSFLLNYSASCFLQIVFGTYTLFLISAIAFSVSLVVRSPLLPAGITIVVCFCGTKRFNSRQATAIPYRKSIGLPGCT